MEKKQNTNAEVQGTKERVRTISLSKANLEDLQDPKLLSTLIRVFEQSDSNTSGSEMMKFSRILIKQEEKQ